MNDFFLLFSAGLADALNPCQFGTLAVFTLFLVWSVRDAQKIVALSLQFILVNLTTLLALRLGFDVRFFAWTAYEAVAAFYYAFVGGLSVLLSLRLLKDWADVLRGKDGRDSFFAGARSFLPRPWLALFIGALLSFWTAWMSHFWPPSAEVTIAANNALLPGKFLSTLLQLAGYGVGQIWLLAAAAVVYFAFLNSASLREKVREKLSLVYVAAAGFYAAVGGGLVYLFLTKLF